MNPSDITHEIEPVIAFFMLNGKLKTNQQWLYGVGNGIHLLYVQVLAPSKAENIAYRAHFCLFRNSLYLHISLQIKYFFCNIL